LKNKRKNRIQTLLFHLGICDEDSIESFWPKVRDRDDVAVMKCKKSGIIFLSRSDHMDISFYEEQKGAKYFSAQNRKNVIFNRLEDDQRRNRQFRDMICNKKWLDIGTGGGGILDLLSPVALETTAVEPQKDLRNELVKLGYRVYPNIEEVPNCDFDVVTLFHVFEHFTDPIEILRSILERIKEGGKIVIEVPHANDFLISFLDLDSFKAFTLSSEHLILHTRESLTIFLQKAGFKNIIIYGHQRYPLANHLYWLAKGKPGGHLVWSHLRTLDLDNSYSQMLARLDRTDTLIAIAQK